MASSTPLVPINAQGNDLPFFERLRYIALDPSDLRKYLLLMARFHFSDPTHYGIMQDNLGSLVYAKDCDDLEEDQSLLSIELAFQRGDDEDAQNVENVPKITVSCTDWAMSQVELGNHVQHGANDEEVLRKRCTTKVVFSHITYNPDPALMLATQTAAFFNSVGHSLKDSWDMDKFELSGISQPKIINPPNDDVLLYQVDVSFDLVFNFVWSQWIESKRIKTVAFSIINDL